MSHLVEWLLGPEGLGRREEVLCGGGSPFGNMLGPRTVWVQLRLETVCASMSPGGGFIAGKAHASPVFYLVSSTSAGHLPPLPRRLLAVVAVGGMLLASCWKRDLSCPARFSLEFTQDLPCWEGRAGPGVSVPRKPRHLVYLPMSSQSGLLGRVCAGFLCHQFSKFCFNPTASCWGPGRFCHVGGFLGALRLSSGGFQVLVSCFLWSLSKHYLHFSGLSINQYLTSTSSFLRCASAEYLSPLLTKVNFKNCF